jgi:hypothetical protein
MSLTLFVRADEVFEQERNLLRCMSPFMAQSGHFDASL